MAKIVDETVIELSLEDTPAWVPLFSFGEPWFTLLADLVTEVRTVTGEMPTLIRIKHPLPFTAFGIPIEVVDG